MSRMMKSPKIVFLALMLGTSACSKSPQKKKDDPVNNFGNGAVSDMVQCVRAKCDPGRPQLYVNGVSTPRLTAEINQAVNWQISGRSTMYPGRSYAALRMDFNPQMPRLTVRQSTGMLSGSDSIAVSGQLTAAELQAGSTATVVVRDMTACQVLSTGSANATGNSVCNNSSQPTQYDTTLTATVSVSNNAYNPNGPYAQIPGTPNNMTPNNSMDNLGMRIGIAAVLGGLQALFGQNNNAAGVLGGSVNGAIQGLNQYPYAGGTSNMYNGNGYYNQNAYQPNNNSGYNNGPNNIRGY